MTGELEGWLRLGLTKGVGSATQRTLLATFGLPEQIFNVDRSAIAAVVGTALADQVLAQPDRAMLAKTMAWAETAGNHVLTLADADYPQSLLQIPDPPVLLYATGEPALLRRPALAIVGARSATPQGIANAEAFARYLGDAGLTIISGLALGIDTAAHRGALAGGAPTIAVVGTGADRVYPARNRELAHAIAAQGVILSEFPLGTPPLPHNFPKRNRLIAGLSKGVLIVEAAVGSGSLITARLAAECGREVFAIPGSIHSPLARGCHRLIREGAKLVETAQDVIEELAGALPPQPRTVTAEPASSRARPPNRTPPAAAPRAASDTAPVDDDALKLLESIGHDPVDIDTLATRSGLTLDALYAILLPLELDGHVARLPGGRFQRL
ncbi:MAG TPA: DNA-processing protein DprA [Rhodocyclaceae bacterium]|nr:DNA-processing protein DprA [Rhodocyclaceae bacterium]